MEEITSFINRIPNFENLKPSEMIDYFGLFYLDEVKKENFVANDISIAFSELRIVPYSNIPQYLKRFSEKGKQQKFIRIKEGFHFVRGYDEILKSKLAIKEKSFIDFEINTETLDWNPNYIPLLNSRDKKSAHFFTKLYYLFYHLENSLRKFLKKRLSSIIGNDWEAEIISKVDLTKAVSIRQQTDLSEMMEERGDNILHYCMWDDYGKIIKFYPTIFNSQKESDEIFAHLSSMTKIRNGIAHNSATIPKDYLDELNVFLKKFVKILNKY